MVFEHTYSSVDTLLSIKNVISRHKSASLFYRVVVVVVEMVVGCESLLGHERHFVFLIDRTIE